MVMASNLHSLKQSEQPIQAFPQAFFATPPLSLLTQLTKILRPLGPRRLSSMMNFGQALTQAPQATHLSSMITGSLVSLSMYIASNSQAWTQSAIPRQPQLQSVSPL